MKKYGVSDYHLQSALQETLLHQLTHYTSVCIKPVGSPFELELMGKLTLKTDQRGTRVVMKTDEVEQVLSVNWRSVHLMRLNPQHNTLTLYNGARDILSIRCPDGTFREDILISGLLQPIPRSPINTPELKIGSNGWHLSPVNAKDRHAYLHYLNDPLIYRYTMNIPYPYTEKDADQWLSTLDLRQWESNAIFNMAIRNASGELCGGIGISHHAHKTHQGEIGYWLAQPYWGQGVMSLAVQKFCQWALDTFKLQRITAQIMDINKGSERVLQKSGFQLEGIMTRHFVKDSTTYDGKLYAFTPTA